MKTEIIYQVKVHHMTHYPKKPWYWQIWKGKKLAAGGYCKNKKDAVNDARLALPGALATRPNTAPSERRSNDAARDSGTESANSRSLR